MKEYKKKWYENNKEEMSLRCKERYENNKEHILQKHKQYKIEHTEELKASYKKWNIKVECGCGSSHTLAHKSCHEKTLKHKNYIEQLEN